MHIKRKNRKHILSWRIVCVSTFIMVAVSFIFNMFFIHMSSSVVEISTNFPLADWHQRRRDRNHLKSVSSGMGSYSKSREMGSETINRPYRRRRGPFNQLIVHDTIDSSNAHTFQVDPMLQVTPGEETQSQYEHANDDRMGDECIPMNSWQNQNFPTCNSIHEIDMRLFGARNQVRNIIEFVDDHSSILGKGWFRITWKAILGSSSEVVALKTLRPDREFLEEYYELHRKDAVAMERLTSSPYVINIYSFCGQSALNEFADFIDGFRDFKSFARRIGGSKEMRVTKLKLQISTMLALGIMHVHEIDGSNNASMVHYDVNPMNVAVTKGGIPKFNDFNVAMFMKWNVSSNQRCGFYGRLHEPWWRAPEEMIENSPLMTTSPNETKKITPMLDEKVDIYSLGNLIYLLLTGHSPRGKTDPNRMNDVRRSVQNGTPPIIDEIYENSTEPAIVTMINALSLCFEPNPYRRASARDIAGILLQKLDDLNADESPNAIPTATQTN